MHNVTDSRTPGGEGEGEGEAAPAREADDKPAAAIRGFAAAPRLRQVSARTFFPVEQTAPPGWLLALIAVGGATLAGARQGSTGLNTIWAEDGQVFYQGALTSPVHAFVESWQGYLSTGPRIIAAVVTVFPVSWAAGAFAVADAIVMGLLAALTYRACGEHIRNPWLRALPAVTIAACPVGPETWGAVSNLQWPLFFVAVVVLLWNPRHPVPIAAGAVTVLLLALSSPFGVLLMPIAVARIAVLPSDRGTVIPLTALAGVALQSVNIAIANGRPDTYSAIVPGPIAKFYAKYVAGNGFFGIRYPVPWPQPGTTVVIAVVAALVLVAASGRLRQLAVAVLALAYSVGFFAVLMVLSGADTGQYGPPRYFVGPFLLLAFAVTVLFDAVLGGGAAWRAGWSGWPGWPEWPEWPGWSGWPGLRGGSAVRLRFPRLRLTRLRLTGVSRFAAVLLCAALAGCLVWSVGTSWHVTFAARRQPTWSAALASGHARCEHGARTASVRITPHTPPYWHVTLTCAQLGVTKR